MVTLRQRTPVKTVESEPKVVDLTILDDDSPSEPDSLLKNLRRRWELASVLNFFNVFEALVLDKLKLTAEEIEMGLVESNAINAKLHISLLKGIPPMNKALDNAESDAWITVLCNKLAPWWPSIAEGEIPLTAHKGEEKSKYRELDPVDRLRFLKALCELRVQQDDARTYILENTKEGDLDFPFRKRKLGGAGKKTSYWFDGSDIQGYRLYREVNGISKSAKARKSAYSDVSCVCWETEATNLDEFQRVAKELSSSKASLAAIGEIIVTDAIPVVEKYHKKKEREIKKKMKKEMVVNVTFSRPVRTTRSCRNRMPATYTFDAFDKMIDDAVEDTVEIDQDDEEGSEQESGSMGSNDSSEGDKMNSTEETPESEKMKSTEDEAPESDKIKSTEDEAPISNNDNVKEKEKNKDNAEPNGEISTTNMLGRRLTRALRPLLV